MVQNALLIKCIFIEHWKQNLHYNAHHTNKITKLRHFEVDNVLELHQ